MDLAYVKNTFKRYLQPFEGKHKELKIIGDKAVIIFELEWYFLNKSCFQNIWNQLLTFLNITQMEIKDINVKDE